MNDDPIPFILTVVLAVISFFTGHAVGFDSGKSNVSEKAIRAGVAYYTNDASGVAQFKWKECK